MMPIGRLDDGMVVVGRTTELPVALPRRRTGQRRRGARGKWLGDHDGEAVEPGPDGSPGASGAAGALPAAPSPNRRSIGCPASSTAPRPRSICRPCRAPSRRWWARRPRKPCPMPTRRSRPSPRWIFSGNSVESTARLQKVVAPYLNRKLTRGDLAQLKYDITRLYYEDGYILVRVVTPPQDLTKGNLQIAIYEAKIEKIENNKGIVAQFIIDGITSEITPGTVFNESEVESMVRDIDDLPGVAAAVDLRPGSQLGTTDLDLALKQVEGFPAVGLGQQLRLEADRRMAVQRQFPVRQSARPGRALCAERHRLERLPLHHPGRHPDAHRAAQRHPRHQLSLQQQRHRQRLCHAGAERADERLQDRALERAAEYGQAEVHRAGRLRCPPSRLDDPERQHHPIVRYRFANSPSTAPICCGCRTRRC